MKRRLKTYADCELAYLEAEKTRDLTATCLNEVLAGNVSWFKGSLADGAPIEVGLVRPHSPVGGYVIVKADGCTTAHLFDEWAAMHQRQAVNGNGDCLALLPLIEQMRIARSNAMQSVRAA